MISIKSEKLSSIEAYMKAGAYVFMALPNAKHNAEPEGYHNSFNNIADLQKWLEEHPRYKQGNIGIDLGRSPLLVVDVDRHAKNGLESLKQRLKDLHVERESIPETYLEKTPSGGLHIFYEDSHNDSETRDINALDGVDVLQSGGVIVSPSSIGGNEYQGMNSFDKLQSKPAWVNRLGDVQGHKANSGRRSAKYSNYERLNMLMNGFDNGQRNEQATSLVGWLLKLRIQPSQALEIANTANSHSVDPLPQREIDSVYTSVLKREVKRLKKNR